MDWEEPGYMGSNEEVSWPYTWLRQIHKVVTLAGTQDPTVGVDRHFDTSAFAFAQANLTLGVGIRCEVMPSTPSSSLPVRLSARLVQRLGTMGPSLIEQ